MKQLPESETYEAGLLYWPYRESLRRVIGEVVDRAPQSGRVLDIMCGPGYLLGRISEQRRDLVLCGIDLDERYVAHGQGAYPASSFELGDVLTWQPDTHFDAVICTGALHHLPYEAQGTAIANIATMVKPKGFVIISDCYVDNYGTEQERKLAAAKLGYEYLRETIENGAPSQVLDWTVDIISNDVLKAEYKPSYEQRLPLLEAAFLEVVTQKVWPATDGYGYGDYLHACTVPRI